MENGHMDTARWSRVSTRAWDLSRARREAYDRECANFKASWTHMMADPYYNPNLTRMTEDFALL